MGEQKRKAENALISVLIPERGRPDMLERLICSLIDKAGSDERYEILVAIDSDDPAWDDREPVPHAKVRYLKRPRPITLGEKLNELGRLSAGEIMWFIANDHIVDTPGWPTKFRHAVQKLPNGIGVPFVRDTLHPDHASYPIITRRMMEATGFAFAPWFPAWFIDTWADQIGILTNIRFEIDVEVSAPEGRGKSHGLKDVTFWATFFREMLPMRVRDAINLLMRAYGQDSAHFKEAMKGIEQRQALCEARTRHLVTPEFAALWEARTESEPAPNYKEVKDYAETMMAKLRAERPHAPRVAICVPSGRQWEGTTANCIAALSAYSAARGVELAMINVQSSQISHGRNETVRVALSANVDYLLWVDSDMKIPPDALMRLLHHGKDICGAVYNKRVPRPDGTYETLGRLKGPRPAELNDGLYEAEYLPGGLMLVKADVYRKIKWPWYVEAYRWEGNDGVEAFSNLLRAYFVNVPPDEVFEELADSKLGQWLQSNYIVGAENGSTKIWSEDLVFCAQAKKAGFQVWADLKLSNDTAHLGTIEVTCKLPDDTVRLAEDTVRNP